MNRAYFRNPRHLIWFFGALLFIILLKLYLVNGQSFCVFNSIVDDRLFVEQAKSIAEGRWLGDYDNRTLIKGPVYPIWIALISKTGLPLLLSEHFLYIFACLFFINSISSMVTKPLFLLIVFSVLLFNPMSYTDWIMNMAFRAGIYPSLTLLVLSCTLKLLAKEKPSPILRFLWSLSLGFFLSAFWLTREESIWIIPFLASVIIFDILNTIRKRHLLSLRLEVTLWALPFVFLFLAVMTVCSVNKIYYNIFDYIEIRNGTFEEAYGSLVRVKQKTFKPAVPVTKETRKKIYAVSDAFRELEPFLEGDIGKRYIPNLYYLKKRFEQGRVNDRVKKAINKFLRQDVSGIWRHIWQQSTPDNWDILGISFIWVFRDAVAAAGHYDSWATARKYYIQLTSEIDEACEEGRLDCLSNRKTLVPIWRYSYTVPLIKTFLYGCYATASFFGFDPYSGHCSSDPAAMDLFIDVTGESPNSLGTAERNTRIRILESIGRVYQLVFPFVCGIVLFLYFISGIRDFRRGYFCPYWIIATSIGLSLIALILGLSFIHVTSFPAFDTRYLAPAYPLLLIFCIFTWFAWRRYNWPYCVQ